jgi:CubicO group peptidase (beta-lactamase class C family)
MRNKIMPLGALAAASGALLIAACGSSAVPRNATSSSKRAPTTRGGGLASPDAYSECMRAHGVHNFPNPVDGHITLTPSSGINPSSPTFVAASNACASLAPSGGTPPVGAGGTSTSGSGRDPTAVAPTATAWRSFGAWVAQQTAAGQFSGTALVADGDRQMLASGYGMANRATRTVNTPQTKFCIASIGKLFTAVAIAQLAEQHKLAFNALVGKYVPGLPAAIADHVTIADLLTMTSGLGNIVLSRRDPPRTIAGMSALITEERLRFKPGARFLYSNDGYILLGAVIQNLSGESYADYLRAHIFKPTGMTTTQYQTYIPARVPGMAHGYAVIGSTLRDISTMPQIANPSGGVSSTAGDLVKFAQAILDHKLLTPPMTKTVLIPRVNSPQPGGPPVDKYTYGFSYQRLGRATVVGHNGGTPGYEGQLDIYPRNGYVVVVLANQDQTMLPVIQRSEAILTGS